MPEEIVEKRSLFCVLVGIVLLQPGEVPDFPAHRREGARIGQADGSEIRLRIVQRQQKVLHALVEPGGDIADQAFARRCKIVKTDRASCHALEFFREQLFERRAGGTQELVGRTRRTRDIDEKRPEQRVGQPLILAEQFDIEEVAGMLAVERRVHLAREQILEGEDAFQQSRSGLRPFPLRASAGVH